MRPSSLVGVSKGMRMRRWPAVAVLCTLSLVVAPRADAQNSAPPIEDLLAWLDDPTRQWLATAELQRVSSLAVPRLLEPNRLVLGPHGSLSAPLLALAKIGEPAVPAIVNHIRRAWSGTPTDRGQGLYPLIQTLGTIGPAAVPALIEIVDLAGTNHDAVQSALDAIVQMEPRTRHFGQIVSPWAFWHTDDTLVRLERAMGPVLPQVERALDRAMQHSPAQPPASAPSAAYLLARWGSPVQRTRGLQLMEDVARSASAYGDEALARLYAVNAPAVAAFIRTAPNLPLGNELAGSGRLRKAIALQQLGERDYGALVDDAIRIGRPTDRLEAIDFLGKTADLGNVQRLLALLDDRTKWGNKTIGEAAFPALWRLTFQDLPADRAVWNDWYAKHRDTEHATLERQWINGARTSIVTMPIWTANAWMETIRWTRNPDVLPVVTAYLRRADLVSWATGPNSGTFGSGDGPNGARVPAAVSLLLRLAQDGVAGAVDALESCRLAADFDVRTFGSMALAAYRPRRAADYLAAELSATEMVRRSQTGERLLQIGDARGIAARIDALEAGSAMFGGGTVRDGGAPGELERDSSRGVRMFACRDLRVYTQQPLPCDPAAEGVALRSQVTAWRDWWEASRSTFAVRTRQARLDLESMYRVRPVTVGNFIAR